jgi:hypothetical protein
MQLTGNQGQTGKQLGQNLIAGMGEFSDLLVTELQARFYEQNLRGNVMSAGMLLTSISASTFNVATGSSATLSTAATSTPIVGLWNPITSGINAVILQAVVSIITTALQTTGCGPLSWVAFVGQSAAISTALAITNRKIGGAPGQCKNVSGVALTGLQNIGAVIGASPIPVPMMNLSSLQTAAGQNTPQGGPGVENVDGSIIVPPGGILGLYCSGTPVANSAASSLLWNEIPV